MRLICCWFLVRRYSFDRSVCLPVVLQETIMKHLDPPSCVFIFAGYDEPMNDFLRVNEGLTRRIPYRMCVRPVLYCSLALVVWFVDCF